MIDVRKAAMTEPTGHLLLWENETMQLIPREVVPFDVIPKEYLRWRAERAGDPGRWHLASFTLELSIDQAKGGE